MCRKDHDPATLGVDINMFFSHATFMCGGKQASESETKVDFYKMFTHCGFAAHFTLPQQT